VFDVTTRRGRERVREVWTGVRPSTLSGDELEAAHRAGHEIGGDDWFVGRDPREMTRAELEAMGHEAMSPMEAIRAKCLDCCAGSAHDVRCCTAMACPSWPFRLGKNPWRAPASEAQREHARSMGAKRAQISVEQHSGNASSDEVSAPVPR